MCYWEENILIYVIRGYILKIPLSQWFYYQYPLINYLEGDDSCHKCGYEFKNSEDFSSCYCSNSRKSCTLKIYKCKICDSQFSTKQRCYIHTKSKYIPSRRPVSSTDQALPSCFYFRISWILMERPWNHFFGSCGFLQGLRS